MVVSNIAWGAAFRVGVPLLAARTLGGNVGALGLLMGGYGVGNIVSNFVVGSIPVRRPAMVMIVAQFVLGVGFALSQSRERCPSHLFGIAFAAIGGPMGDITLATMLQRDFPRDQIGKVFSLRFTLSYVGYGVRAGRSPARCSRSPPGVGIGLCAFVMAAMGVTGIVRFRFREPVNTLWENREDAKTRRIQVR